MIVNEKKRNGLIRTKTRGQMFLVALVIPLPRRKYLVLIFTRMTSHAKASIFRGSKPFTLTMSNKNDARGSIKR
jgi:hypothetical protein